ncbi:MAG: hypothetical protein ACLQLG_03500 [Thermoguttaceae bacterium]
MRAWIALALLSASWLFGVGLYGPANFPAWVVMVAAGTLLLIVDPASSGATAGLPSSARNTVGQANRGTRHFIPVGPRETWLALLLLAPAVVATTGPYRAGPLLLTAGLALALLASGRPRLKAAATAAFTAGLVLIVQGAAVAVYIAQTARTHDAPWPTAPLLAGIMNWLGAEATADGPYLVTHTMRETHRLAVTWDLGLDPGTLCFFLGGLVLLGLRPLRHSTRLKAAAVLALVIACWLPVRAVLLTAVYLHRAMRFPYDWPLHVMNHFFSPWVSLTLLAPPLLLAWRLIRPRDENAEQPAEPDPLGKGVRATAGLSSSAASTVGQANRGTRLAALAPPSPWRRSGAVALVLAGAALLAVAGQLDPVGTRKAGRVKFVERHSTWSPTTRPYDTATYGEAASYNYAAAYRWLGQFFTMSQLLESDKIDDATLAGCDCLVIKLPSVRYAPEEADAVVRFVARGGGLLLIGDHTNVDRSAAYMNDITRSFGFTYRDDLLFGTVGSPYDEHYEAAATPHPAVAHVPWFDFAVSCSVDPGSSRGRPAILQTGLWSMPPDYHMDNYHPIPQHCPGMRVGAFIQAWAARHGQGRAMAFTDSTIFSNFCLFQPGKSELLLNMLEWLNHRDTGFDTAAVLLGLGLAAVAAAAWLARRWPAAWLVLLAAAVGGWSVAAVATAALQRRALPLPPVLRPQTRVVIDRTTSVVPLAQGAFNEDQEGRGFGLLEQWIPRLGYYTVRAAGAEAFSGNALVVICPTRRVDAVFRERLVRYVADGGKLLLLDSPENSASTADDLLRPFGLSILRNQAWQGTLTLKGQWPALHVDQAWEVAGGRPVATLGTRPIAAVAPKGKGLVMAVGFGALWNDAGMGFEWTEKPDTEMLSRYQAMFALMQLLVEGKPVIAPAK